MKHILILVVMILVYVPLVIAFSWISSVLTAQLCIDSAGQVITDNFCKITSMFAPAFALLVAYLGAAWLVGRRSAKKTNGE